MLVNLEIAAVREPCVKESRGIGREGRPVDAIGRDDERGVEAGGSDSAALEFGDLAREIRLSCTQDARCCAVGREFEACD